MTSVAFFELLGDELRPCEDRGPSFLIATPSSPPLPPPPPLSSQCTKRRLRRLARRGTRGRCGALNYKGIDKKYPLRTPSFLTRWPPPIEMVGISYQVEIQYGPIHHPRSVTERLIVVIYVQKGVDVPQEIVDRAIDMVRVRLIKGQRAMDEMIKVAEERKRQNDRQREWERDRTKMRGESGDRDR